MRPVADICICKIIPKDIEMIYLFYLYFWGEVWGPGATDVSGSTGLKKSS